MAIQLVLAINEDGAIGYKNKLLYHIPEDLKRFQQITTYNEHNVRNLLLMGKLTFMSLPSVLKNRINVVATRDTSFTVDDYHVTVCNSIENAINQYKCAGNDKELFIIGGRQVIEQTINDIEIIHLTYIYDSGKKADTYFDLNWLEDFEEIDRVENYSDKYECRYDFITYIRKGKVVE